MGITNRIQHAWDAFKNNGFTRPDHGSSQWGPTFKTVVSYNSSGFVSSIYNRIALDVSMAKIRHVTVDPDTEDVKPQKSGLNYCLGVEANVDQTGIQFMHDLVYSMFDEGVVAVVPVETTSSPSISNSYDIKTMRVGRIVQWYPRHVTVRLYNDATGQNEDIILEKKMVAIIENPLYAVMNSDNSTLKRLVSKINQLDRIDDLAASGRLDLILSVPYGVRTDKQRDMVTSRINALEAQLSQGKHGIAYLDATEKVTQLNRPIESQLAGRVDELKKEFYNQLGLTQTIFDGTATEEELRIYYSRTIDPIIEHIIAEFSRKFITKTARSQGHEIQYYRDMFKFVTIEMLSTLTDTVRRNYVMSSNEVRKILGLRPSDDPRADELFNPNIADKNQDGISSSAVPTEPSKQVEDAKVKRSLTSLANQNRNV
jgi:hypothetical protein